MPDLQEFRNLIYAITAGNEEGSLTCPSLEAARAVYHICKAARLLGFPIEDEDGCFYRIFPHNSYWVINTKPFSEFGISLTAYKRLLELGYADLTEDDMLASGNSNLDHLYAKEISRTDPMLIQLMHELGPENVSNKNDLKMLEVPAFLEVSILVYMNGAEMLTDGKVFWY